MVQPVTRRGFLRGASTAVGLVAAGALLSLSLLEPAHAAINPLDTYPDRGWERLYRDVYAYDDSYIFMCTPNCTHNCYLRAYVKNGVVTRCGPSQRYHEASDVYGTKASHRWDPRHCNKGLAIVRRFNGDRRVKSPMIRRGFKEWVERGFLRDADGLPPGHPMVTGQQTIDFDLCNVEYSKLALCWGMNWISTKMPDAHFLTEARR